MNRQRELNWFFRRIRRAIRITLQTKKINYTKFFVRHFGPVPYFDVDLGKTVDLRSYLRADSRKPGISGFMRLKNEEQFVEMTIESVVGCLDELIIVHNGCTDRTPEIIESCRRRHPDRIRIFEYKPSVFPPGSIEHRQEPMGSPHSLVNYYNYALAKTTHRIAIKIDGDEFYLYRPFKQLTDDLRDSKRSTPIGVSGVNLWDENGEIHVNAHYPVLGGMDKGFFMVSPQNFFAHYRHYELFTHAFERSAGILFYHLKGMKKDRGIGNYCLQPRATTFSSEKTSKLTSPRLISWQDSSHIIGNLEELPHPATLGLRARH
jgi:glycosyltransferase involved in cell wall biosynthesis